jgi:hypothetical protein
VHVDVAEVKEDMLLEGERNSVKRKITKISG